MILHFKHVILSVQHTTSMTVEYTVNTNERNFITALQMRLEGYTQMSDAGSVMFDFRHSTHPLLDKN